MQIRFLKISLYYAAFTLFEKVDFQILKFKFNACSMKQTFYPLHKLKIAQT